MERALSTSGGARPRSPQPDSLPSLALHAGTTQSFSMPGYIAFISCGEGGGLDEEAAAGEVYGE